MRALLVELNPSSQPVTPIALGCLGAVLEAGGHEVRILGLGASSRFSPASLARFVQDFAPRLVGFSAYQRNIFHVKALAALVKEAAPGAAIILGGPQAAFLPESSLEALPDVDYLCRGEGEAVIGVLAEAIAAGGNGAAVPGATARAPCGGYATGAAPALAKSLDDYPSPWLSGLLDPSELDEAIMLTSRGCAHDCVFCHTPRASGRSVRSLSPERAVAEIAYVARRGSGRLWFADPDFAFDRRRALFILEEVARQDLRAALWLEARADHLDPELLALMKRAGVHTVAMGLESASADTCRQLGKSLDPERVRLAARQALAAGLDVELFSQFALPQERREDALCTLRFVQEAGVKIRGNSNAQQMHVYFGSKICADPARYGIRPLRARFDPCLSLGTEFETEWMTRGEIESVQAAWRAASQDGGKRVVS
ncbi:MAG: cobalamin B12-binding domain-containing protein [Planctomycetes bacterium]|nr:cobalamin B12-binding domain-containing protein [Planctomycetota bacterium]